MLMIMSDLATKKREEEVTPAPRVTPPAQEDMMARLANLKEARISRAEPTVTEDTRRRMIQGLCTEFFTACVDKAKKEGTSGAFSNSEMKQYFG
jgi:hypothetical protein